MHRICTAHDSCISLWPLCIFHPRHETGTLRKTNTVFVLLILCRPCECQISVCVCVFDANVKRGIPSEYGTMGHQNGNKWEQIQIETNGKQKWLMTNLRSLLLFYRSIWSRVKQEKLQPDLDPPDPSFFPTVPSLYQVFPFLRYRTRTPAYSLS